MKNKKVLALALSAGLVVGGAATSFAAAPNEPFNPNADELTFEKLLETGEMTDQELFDTLDNLPETDENTEEYLSRTEIEVGQDGGETLTNLAHELELEKEGIRRASENSGSTTLDPYAPNNYNPNTEPFTQEDLRKAVGAAADNNNGNPDTNPAPISWNILTNEIGVGRNDFRNAEALLNGGEVVDQNDENKVDVSVESLQSYIDEFERVRSELEGMDENDPEYDEIYNYLINLRDYIVRVASFIADTNDKVDGKLVNSDEHTTDYVINKPLKEEDLFVHGEPTKGAWSSDVAPELPKELTSDDLFPKSDENLTIDTRHTEDDEYINKTKEELSPIELFGHEFEEWVEDDYVNKTDDEAIFGILPMTDFVDAEYQTIRRENKDMYKGEEKVVQKGRNGIWQLNEEGKRYRLVQDPVDEIIEYGTKERPVTRPWWNDLTGPNWTWWSIFGNNCDDNISIPAPTPAPSVDPVRPNPVKPNPITPSPVTPAPTTGGITVVTPAPTTTPVVSEDDKVVVPTPAKPVEKDDDKVVVPTPAETEDDTVVTPEKETTTDDTTVDNTTTDETIENTNTEDETNVEVDNNDDDAAPSTDDEDDDAAPVKEKEVVKEKVVVKEAAKAAPAKATSNPKTGVAGLSAVAGTMAISMAGIVATRKRNK